MDPLPPFLKDRGSHGQGTASRTMGDHGGAFESDTFHAEFPSMALVFRPQINDLHLTLGRKAVHRADQTQTSQLIREQINADLGLTLFQYWRSFVYSIGK